MISVPFGKVNKSKEDKVWQPNNSSDELKIDPVSVRQVNELTSK